MLDERARSLQVVEPDRVGLVVEGDLPALHRREPTRDGTSRAGAPHPTGHASLLDRPSRPRVRSAGAHGHSNGSGTVRLIYATFTIDGKSTKGVSLFEWTGALKCEDGTSRDAGGSVLAPLKGVKFSGRSSSGEQTVSLKGRFTANTKLTGTVRLTTDGPTPARRCDTGPVTFKAKRK
jgi:hypothetical protein